MHWCILLLILSVCNREFPEVTSLCPDTACMISLKVIDFSHFSRHGMSLEIDMVLEHSYVVAYRWLYLIVLH